MAEETNAPAAPESTGQASGTSQAVDTPQSDASSEAPVQGGTPTPQDKPAKSEGSKKPNLYEMPEFKAFQRSYNQQQQELKQLRAQMKELATKDLDDFEKVQYEKQELEQQLQQMQQQVQLTQMEQQRQQDLMKLSQMSGAPTDLLDKAENYDVAVEMAMEFMKQQQAKLSKEEAARQRQKQEANSVDLGGGKASTPESRNDERAREALNSKDAISYVKLLFSPDSD